MLPYSFHEINAPAGYGSPVRRDVHPGEMTPVLRHEPRIHSYGSEKNRDIDFVIQDNEQPALDFPQYEVYLMFAEFFL